MTEKLKTLLHEQAETVDFGRPDLHAITEVGDRRIRRRHSIGLVGGLAVLAIVGGVAAAVVDEDDEPRVAGDALPTSAVSWASGSTLYAGGESRDVGHSIAAYVATASGYVFTDEAGTVWSYVDEVVREVGATADDNPRLVGDTDGTLVAWVDRSGDAPAFVVLDTGTGEVTTLDTETSAGMGALADERDPAYVYAVDGRTVYLRDHRGAVGIDVETDAVVWQKPGARNGFDLVAAEDGVLARAGGVGGTVLEGPGGDVTLRDVYGSQAAFSPSGRWISVDADEPEVFDARNGERVRIDIGDRVFGTGFAWLDDERLIAIAARTEKGPVELLTCVVPAGTCTQTAQFGDFDAFVQDFLLPLGEPFES